MEGDCFLPSKRREISKVCRAARLSAPELLRNGEDRAHRLYGTDEESAQYRAGIGEEIRYDFDRRRVEAVHIVFSSDLNRETLEGSHCERTHTTRLNTKLSSPRMHMPTTLCREFELYCEVGGERELLLSVSDNRKRAYDVKVGRNADALVLIPRASWGEGKDVPIISFDFR